MLYNGVLFQANEDTDQTEMSLYCAVLICVLLEVSLEYTSHLFYDKQKQYIRYLQEVLGMPIVSTKNSKE